MIFAIVPFLVVVYAILSYLILAAAIFGIAQKYTLITLLLVTFSAWFLFILKRKMNFTEILHGKRIALFLLCGGFIGVLMHIFVIPPYMRDDMIYHLLIPKHIAHTGKYLIDPYNINSNFPMLFEMPLTYIEMMKGFLSPFCINLAFLACLGVTISIFGRRHFSLSSRISLISFIVIITTPIFYNLVHSCYVEIFFSLCILLASYNYLIFMEDRNKPRFWFNAMLFIGIACATKYLGLIFLALLAAYEFFRAVHRKHYYVGLLIAILVCIPWYIKSWIITGNPVYPFANDFFHSSFVSHDRLIIFKGLLSDYNAGRTMIDYFLLPFRLLAGWNPDPHVHRLGFDGKLSLFFILFFLGFGIRNEKKRFLSLLAIIYCIIWSLGSQQVRFLLPVIIPISISGLSLIAHIKLRQTNNVILLFFLAVFTQNAWNIWQSAKQEEIIDLIKGKIDRNTFLIHKMPVSFGLALKVNQLLKDTEARVMTIGTFGRNYYFNVPIFSNTYYEEEIFDRSFKKNAADTAVISDFFRKKKISHILFNLQQYNPIVCDSTIFDCTQRSLWLAQHCEQFYYNGTGLICRIKNL